MEAIARARNFARLPPYRVNLTAWYRAHSGMKNVNGKCAQWNDATNQNNNLVQATASAQPTISSEGHIKTDGVAQYMQATYTLNQPCAYFMAFSTTQWTLNATLIDGGTATASISQITASPDLQANAGSALTVDGSIPIATKGVLGFVMNGATSQYTACGGAAPVNTTGNAGANNPGGITIGANLSAANFAKVTIKEILVYNGTLNATQIQTILRYLGRVGNVGGI
jgi:hypothetical protein